MSNKINDLDIENWKSLDDILTDSLWVIDKRDSSGVHNSKYHGNFIPQIPNQLLKRFTKEGDFVLDLFAGSGTSLIEAQRLGRNAVGIELQEAVAKDAIKLVRKEKKATIADIYVGDSTEIDLATIIKNYEKQNFQFAFFHPPYWDIVKFSDNEKDLSNAKSLNEFLDQLGKAIDNVYTVLENGRYCALIIADKYANSEIVPLGFLTMQEFLKRNFSLKSIIVKNFESTKGKQNQAALWRYRALAGNFYIFKHEYIMIFKKMKLKKS